MADAAALYLRLAAANVRSQLQYRLSFALETLGTFLISILDFVAVLLIFANVPRLAGWSVHEVAFLYATSAVSFSLAELAVGHSEALAQRIRTGTFDTLLVRPRGTLFQIVSSELPLRRLGRTAQGAAVLVYALATTPIDWTPGRVAMLPLMLASGIVLFASLWVAGMCLLFWTVDGAEFTNAFTYGGQTLTQYPLDVYSAWLRRFLGYLIPTAFVAYFPALYVLGKEDALGLPHALRFASPAVALASACVAGLLWRAAVRRYRGGGG